MRVYATLKMSLNIALGGNHEAKGHFDIVTHKPDITADDIILMNEGELVF